MCFNLAKENREKYKENTIQCIVIEKIGDDSINDDYILVDAENKKIKKIKDKNIVFKLLTRKKYLELKETLNGSVKFLKEEGKYILDNLQNPLFFEEGENDLILYVKHSEDNLCLAGLDLVDLIISINFDKNNSIEVRMAKKEEIPIVEEEGEKVKKEEIFKIEEKEEDEEDDSSKCCCGIC